MSENNFHKQSTLGKKRVFNTELSGTPSIIPGLTPTQKFNEKELDAMCKNPRQSAELIRYLIEFIKSL